MTIDRAKRLHGNISTGTQIKSSIYGFHFGEPDKKIVDAARKKRGLLFELASLLSRGSASRENFNFPLGFEKVVWNTFASQSNTFLLAFLQTRRSRFTS